MMNFIERLFCLKEIFPFSEMRDSELGLVADVTEERFYPANYILANSETVITRLFIVIEGGIHLGDGTLLSTIVGTSSLLFDYPLAQDLVTHPEQETQCLTIRKGHFFTMVNECPFFLVGTLNTLSQEKQYIQRSKGN